jgi:hypothetical protein
MSEKTETTSILPLILIAAVLWYSGAFGGSKPSTPDPNQPSPVVVEKDKPTADQCWEALAQCVEKKWIGGELQQHTDHLISIANKLKESGSIPDTSRVDQWRARRIEITPANRAEIAAKLRGK